MLAVKFAIFAIKSPIFSVISTFTRLSTSSNIAGRALAGLKNPLGVIKNIFSSVSPMLRQVGFALLRTPWGAVAGIAIAAGVAIYKYWDQVKAFFSGFWTGLKKGIEPFTSSVGKLIDSMPILAKGWELVSNWVSKAFNWFKQLLQPVNATKEQINAATDAGKSFGEKVGSAISLLMKPLQAVIDAFSWIINTGGKVGSIVSQVTNAEKGQKIGTAITAVKNLITGDPSTSADSKQQTKAIMPPQKKPLPNPVGRGGQAFLPQQTNHITQSFVIHAAPGQSEESIANSVMAKMKQAEGIRLRNSMIDWGYSQ
ncbi:hypothetical protein ACG9Y7_04140 [Acinetobacter gerneri]|uniref:hypothetical protein n=1 Tax=Acinetobacter gerneri TaxID=202952 RepID=UPI003AF6A7AA